MHDGWIILSYEFEPLSIRDSFNPVLGLDCIEGLIDVPVDIEFLTESIKEEHDELMGIMLLVIIEELYFFVDNFLKGLHLVPLEILRRCGPLQFVY